MRPLDWLRRWWRDLTDDPDHDPRPEDEGCAECHRLRQECVALEQRLGKEQEKMRAMESMAIAASQQSRGLVDEYPLDDTTLTPPVRRNPFSGELHEAREFQTIGQREPGRRDKAPTWRTGEGWDSPKLREAMEHNRRRVPTNDKLADRFDRATQAAREIADEQE